MGAWKELTSNTEDAIWDRFELKFAFCPSTTDWPGIREPVQSITYDISHVYGDAEHYERLTLDLSHKLIAAFRRCVAEDGVIHVLDWQHQCFQFMPHAPFSFDSEEDWPIPALPNGDYHIFLDPDIRFGVFGHPWEQTMCVFGRVLVEALGADLPTLFAQPMRIGGKVV